MIFQKDCRRYTYVGFLWYRSYLMNQLNFVSLDQNRGSRDSFVVKTSKIKISDIRNFVVQSIWKISRTEYSFIFSSRRVKTSIFIWFEDSCVSPKVIIDTSIWFFLLLFWFFNFFFQLTLSFLVTNYLIFINVHRKWQNKFIFFFEWKKSTLRSYT